MKDDWPGTGCFPGDTILPAVHHGAAEGGQEGQEGGCTAAGEEEKNYQFNIVQSNPLCCRVNQSKVYPDKFSNHGAKISSTL